MRIPPRSLVMKLSRYISVFVIGMICSSIMFLYVHGQTMDEMMQENRHLTSLNNKLNDEIRGWQDDYNELNEENQQELVIKEVTIEVIDSEDQLDTFIESEVSDQLRQDLTPYINRPVSSVDDTQAALRNLIDGKTFRINSQQVEVQFESMTIYTTLTVHVSIHKVN